MAALSIGMGAGVAVVHAALLRSWPGGGLVGEVARLALVILGGATFVGVGMAVLRVPEGRILVSKLRGFARGGVGR